MNLTLSCLVIFLAFAMTCLTGPVECRPHHLHEHGRPRSSRSNSNSGSSSGSGSDSSGDEKTSDEFDPCAANPCKNNGTCSNTGIDYECACPIYHVGKNCEEFDPCAANPCKNNGTCSNTGIDYECACPIYHVGKNCEEFDPCAATPCKNNGTCNETVNDYQCACPENYFGKNCEGSCLPGWVPNDGKCYYFGQVDLKWEAARDACIDLSMNGGNLVEINDREEQTFLNSQVTTDYVYFWLGVNDRTTEGLFTWTGTGNNLSFYLNFEVFPGDYDCVDFTYYESQEQWSNILCDYVRYYICEMKADYN